MPSRLEILLLKLTLFAILGYLIRVIVLFYLGGLMAFLHKDEAEDVASRNTHSLEWKIVKHKKGWVIERLNGVGNMRVKEYFRINGIYS